MRGRACPQQCSRGGRHAQQVAREREGVYQGQKASIGYKSSMEGPKGGATLIEEGKRGCPGSGIGRGRCRAWPAGGSAVLEACLAAGRAAVMSSACFRPGQGPERGPQGRTPRLGSCCRASAPYSRPGSRRNGEVPESLPLTGSAIFMSKSG